MLLVRPVEHKSFVSFALGSLGEHFLLVFRLDDGSFVSRLNVLVASLENSTEIILYFSFYQLDIRIFQKLLQFVTP